MQIMRCHDNKMLTSDPTNLSHPFPKPSLLPTFLLPAFALQQVKDSISAPSPTFNTEQDMKLSDVNITQLKTQQSHPNNNNNNNNNHSILPPATSPNIFRR